MQGSLCMTLCRRCTEVTPRDELGEREVRLWTDVQFQGKPISFIVDLNQKLAVFGKWDVAHNWLHAHAYVLCFDLTCNRDETKLKIVMASCNYAPSWRKARIIVTYEPCLCGLSTICKVGPNEVMHRYKCTVRLDGCANLSDL